MWLFQFIIGSVVGSFICLVAERVPLGKSIVVPASQCPDCQTKLRFFELIPIVSIILLKFRCRYCHHKLPVSYLFSEFIVGFLFLLTDFGNNYSMYIFFFSLTAFILTLTDIFYLIVEPKLFYPFLLLLCGFHYFLELPFHVITSVFLFIILTSFNYVFTEAIGGGDILLITSWGVLLGNKSLILLLFIASGCALSVSLFYRLILNQKIEQLPFVPFLTFGLFLILYI